MQRTLLDAVHEALETEMAEDARIVVFGEDVGKKGGVFLATKGLQERFGNQRVFNTPLAESSIVGCAIGMALAGLIPVAEIQFADFIHPAFNQLVSEAARMRYRSNGAFSLPLVIRTPYGGGVHGALYHSQSIEAFYAHVPGLKVVVPRDSYTAKGLLIAAIRDPDPVIFLEPKKLYRVKDPFVFRDVPEAAYALPLGQAEIIQEGADITLVAYGAMLFECWKAAQTVAVEISVELIDVQTLRPLDAATILHSVQKTGRVLIVYEDNGFCGYGAEIAAEIVEDQDTFTSLTAPPMRIAGPEVPATPYAKQLEEIFMPNAVKIATAIKELVAWK